MWLKGVTLLDFNEAERFRAKKSAAFEASSV